MSCNWKTALEYRPSPAEVAVREERVTQPEREREKEGERERERAGGCEVQAGRNRKGREMRGNCEVDQF